MKNNQNTEDELELKDLRAKVGIIRCFYNIMAFLQSSAHFPLLILLLRVKDKYYCILGVIILLSSNPVTLLIRAPDKIQRQFFLFLKKKHML